MDRQRLSREMAYLRDRLMREDNKRHNAKENDSRFAALSRNSTLIKVHPVPLCLQAAASLSSRSVLLFPLLAAADPRCAPLLLSL